MFLARNRYEILNPLGNGAFGVVFLAWDQNGKYYAIKRQLKKSNKLSWEIRILLDLKECGNVVPLVELFYSKEIKGGVI